MASGGKLRWIIVTLVAVATVINYIDRGALGFLWPEISKDLGLTKADYAIILNVFTFSYALGQTIFGRIFDWIGTRLGFVLSIVVWSAATMAHAAARGLVSFAIIRAVLGVSEAGNWPGATKANAEWFPINERALAQGIFNSGSAVGGIISAPIIAYLFVFLGSWQAAFIAVGALGFLWLVPWLLIYKGGPDAHPWISDTERQYPHWPTQFCHQFRTRPCAGGTGNPVAAGKLGRDPRIGSDRPDLVAVCGLAAALPG